MAVVSIVILIIIIRLTGIVDFNTLIAGFINKQYVLEQIEAVIKSLSLGIVQVFIYSMLITSAGVLFYQLRKKINIKILYASIFVVFCINLFIDGVAMRTIRNEMSSRPFAVEIQKDYPLDKTNVYVMNNLRSYANLYGMNFYMKNCFHNFELEQPHTGYFLCTEKDLPAIRQQFQGKYTFITLRTSKNIISDVRSKVVLSHFVREL